MSLKDLVEEMDRIHKALTDTHDEVTRLKNEWDYIRKVLVPDKMKELGIEQARLENMGDLTIRADADFFVTKRNMKSLCQWLEDNDHGDLISKTVDKNKLKNFIRNQIIQGKEIPDMVNYTPYMYASLRKI